MAEFLTAAALTMLALVAVSLLRLLYGPSAADRMMAVQLVGTGGAAIALLLAAAQRQPAVLDVALTLALLAAFGSAALSVATSPPAPESPDPEGP